jgi:hypothetical protein
MPFYSLNDPEDNGPGDALVVQRAGPITFSITAEDYSGGTVSLEVAPTSGPGSDIWTTLSYNDLPYITNVNSVLVIYNLAQGLSLRARLTGSTGPTDLYVIFYQ